MANLSIIRSVCESRGISLKELSKILEISEHGLQRILRTNSTKIETLEKIAKELKVPIHIFFPDLLPTKGFSIPDFIFDSFIQHLGRRFERITEKISLYLDYYVYESLRNIYQGYIPLYPFLKSGKKVPLVNSKELELLKSEDIDEFKEPYSKMDSNSKSILSSLKYFLPGFYYSIFFINFMNINNYMEDGFIEDSEINKYWRSWVDLIGNDKNPFDIS